MPPGTRVDHEVGRLSDIITNRMNPCASGIHSTLTNYDELLLPFVYVCVCLFASLYACLTRSLVRSQRFLDNLPVLIVHLS